MSHVTYFYEFGQQPITYEENMFISFYSDFARKAE